MRTLLILLSFTVVLCATAQAQTVTGRVTNAKGEPVSFATVRIKSSKATVAADILADQNISMENRRVVALLIQYGERAVTPDFQDTPLPSR